MTLEPPDSASASVPVELDPRRAGEAVDLLTRAFAGDPMLGYVSPDEHGRSRRTRHILRTVVSYGLRYGQVWVTPGTMQAAAIWMPPGTDHLTLVRRVRTGMVLDRLRLGSAGARRYGVFNRMAGELHHRLISEPHWYLFVIGVDPSAQGKGIGRALIEHMLARTDEQRMPVFLTAPNPAVVPFYERLGFEVAGEAAVPGSTLRIRGLIRRPRG